MRLATCSLRVALRSFAFTAWALLITAGLLAGAEPAQAATGDFIIVLNDDVALPGAVAAQHGATYGFQAKFVYEDALKGYAASLTPEVAAQLGTDPLVRMIVPDRAVHLDADPIPQPPQTPSNAIFRIDADQSSTASGDGHGFVSTNVAVLDTGIDTSHPDLNATSGIDCVAGRDPSPNPDPNGQGTLVAGFVGALDNSIGRVGVSPGATLWAVRVLDSTGFGTDSELICGIDWVTATRTDNDSRNDIAVANLSLGGRGLDDGNCGLSNRDPVHVAICNSTGAGVTYVASAGNDKSDLSHQYPAAYNEVLTTTAMADTDGLPGALGPPVPSGCMVPKTTDDTAAYFSNFAALEEDQAHTIAAPGVCIGSTYPGGQYAIVSGTSFAAPLVAGTVALCVASGKCVALTPAQILTRIVADATAYNESDPGYGFLGDPLHPTKKRYYGFLIHAAEY